MRQVRIIDGEVITLPDPPVHREALMCALEDFARVKNTLLDDLSFTRVEGSAYQPTTKLPGAEGAE